MFVACGLGAFNIAIFHLITHGYFKASYFFLQVLVIHGVHDEQDMDKMVIYFQNENYCNYDVDWYPGNNWFPLFFWLFFKRFNLSSSFNLDQLGSLVYIILAIVSAMMSFTPLD